MFEISRKSVLLENQVFLVYIKIGNTHQIQAACFSKRFSLGRGLKIKINTDTYHTGLCNRRGSKTLETAHPEKPTPSGFRAKNYKIRLG